MRNFILAITIVVISTVILLPYINNIIPKKNKIVKSTDSNYIKFPKKEDFHNSTFLKFNK